MLILAPLLPTVEAIKVRSRDRLVFMALVNDGARAVGIKPLVGSRIPGRSFYVHPGQSRLGWLPCVVVFANQWNGEWNRGWNGRPDYVKCTEYIIPGLDLHRPSMYVAIWLWIPLLLNGNQESYRTNYYSTSIRFPLCTCHDAPNLCLWL